MKIFGHTVYSSFKLRRARVSSRAQFGSLAFLPVILLSSHCSAVDLRGPALRDRVDPDAEQKGRALLGKRTQALYCHGKTCELVLEDHWNSTLPRWFTPLSENTTALRVRYEDLEIDAEYLSGDKTGQHMLLSRRGVPAARGKDGTPTDPGAGTKIYLESMRLYLELPAWLPRAKRVLFQGERVIDGRTYDAVFVTDGELEANKRFDQYVAYLDRKTRRIDYIHFTYRSLFAGYSGVLKFDDFRSHGRGLIVPHKIEVLDDFASKVPVHVFTIDSLRVE